MLGFAGRLLPYALAFTSSLCIMILELVSSRLVARHVGSSLTVWTSVIGIILGGICLGNVLGGRLADRVEPRRAVGPLFALGAFLTLGTLWMNAFVGHLIPSPESINWELRTVLVVTLDFLIPATVLGMVGPVVAKMAVEQAQKAGSAIGDVYFCGAVGSIAGTFISGFILISLEPSSTIVALVAAALAVLAAALILDKIGLVLGLVSGALLGLGAISPLVTTLGLGGVDLGSYRINYLSLAGNAVAVALAIVGLIELVRARRTDVELTSAVAKSTQGGLEPDTPRPSLSDLALLAFIASMVFMALEMVAGRLVQRHLGSSIYSWTSVIGVLLAGLSLGNFLGGKIADFVRSEKQASWLFLAASIFSLSILPLEMQPRWFAHEFMDGEPKSLLSQAITLSKVEMGPVSVAMSWPFRILFVVTLVFFIPSLTLGTVSPVVAKLAIDRLRRFKRTGTAIGQVYAWGMVGSILGTFLTGFLLIDTLGTKGVILLIGTIMAFGATMLGSVGHAVWAGVPLGLCVLAFTPPAWIDAVGKVMPFIEGKRFEKIGKDWGIREELGDPTTSADDLAWVDESNYYYIKINNEPEDNGEVKKRTLVLDNLIHGYFILGHPERLDYDYEHIYALVAYRAAKATGKVKFKPAPEPVEPKKAAEKAAPEPAQPKTDAKADAPKPSEPKSDPKEVPAKTGTKDAPSKPSGGRLSVQVTNDDAKDKVKKGSQPPSGPEDKDSDSKPNAEPEKKAEAAEEPHGSSDPGVEKSEMTSLFLGGGAYCFQRHMQFAYPGTAVDVAEIDPSVTRANFMATGLPRDTTIQTYWGDARQFVELHENSKKYDLVFGDAFNDFSVPWHLTTREFNEKIKKMLSPNGVYMINIIDVYESDAEALLKAQREIEQTDVTNAAKQEQIRANAKAKARRYGGFVGAWTKTAKLTWDNVYIFGTDDTPGSGLRETFVVVASMQPLDLEDLGKRVDDPKFYHKKRRTEPKPYGKADYDAVVDIRSKNIILTDDYAPVENLLAPVAETRADD
jgi:MFS family permease